MQNRSGAPGGPRHPRSAAFLLAQIGASASARFADRLAELGLIPAHAGILRTVSLSAGISQQAHSVLLGMLPSRLVPVLDELEQRDLIERRDNPEDRRLYALHLTDKGTHTLADIGRIAMAHDDAVCAALTRAEREQLSALLRRIADEQGLTPGVHPGFARGNMQQRPQAQSRTPRKTPRQRP